ncbi:hypothetical protein ACNARU_17830 [Proteus sp. WDL240414]|uniref:hypothetical protein n=1 Tax=Proteus sp. WDL240414 TaxID=3399621 RepID=UPI00229B3F8B|nr:hypothetical protein [Proteus mirabilis]
MKKLLVVIFLLLITSSNVIAGWEYSERVDKMRGKTIYFATLESETADNGDKIGLLILSRDNKSANSLSVVVSGDEFDCRVDSLCSGYIKYDDGKVIDLPFTVKRNNKNVAEIIYFESTVDTIRKASHVFIELPLKRKGSSQYELNPQGLTFIGYPQKKDFINAISGFYFDSQYNDYYKKSLSNIKKENGLSCVDATLESSVILGVKPNSLELCFLDGYLITASLTLPYSKKLKSNLINVINKDRNVSDEDKATDEYSLWMSDYYSSISSIFMTGKDKVIKITMIYQVNANLVKVTEHE